MSVELKLRLHLKGAIGLLGGGNPYTNVDFGSRRLLAVKSTGRSRWLFGGIKTYGTAYDRSFHFQSDGGRRIGFARVYVRSVFPWLAFSRGAHGVYKCFHLLFTRLAPGEAGEVLGESADAPGELLPVCRVLTVPEAEIPAGIDIIDAEIARAESEGARPDDRRYAALQLAHAALEAPMQQKGHRRHWLESGILLCGATLVNHKHARRLQIEWQKLADADADEAAARAFKARLDKVTAPMVLGPHGLYPGLAMIDRAKVEADLASLMETLRGLGCQPFLNSGTLLGYVRDGRPIAHDDDFDLGLVLPGQTMDDVFASWRMVRRKLLETWPVIDKGRFDALFLADGVQVDLFPAWVLEGRTYVYPYCYGDTSEADLLPLAEMDTGTAKLAIPANPEAMLVQNYGPNWRVPDPYWKFNWGKANSRFVREFKGLKARVG